MQSLRATLRLCAAEHVHWPAWLITQHYLVLPATQVQSHQSALSHSLAPQIEALIAKAEVVVSSQAKRVTNLEERLEIVRSAARQQLGAAAQASVSAGATAAAGAGADETQEADDADVGRSKLDGLEMRELTVAQRRKVVMLRGKRDRLEREWRELTEEDDQA